MADPIDFGKYEQPAQINFSKYENAPQPQKDQFAQDREITEAWAQNHPILGPAARFLVAGGQTAANAITKTPGQIYHAITDPASAEEMGLPYEHRVASRLIGLKPAIEAGQDYASGKVTPKGAASVLPEALGTGVGQVSGSSVYGKAAETAPEVMTAAGKRVIAPAARGIGKTATAIGESLDPDVVGLVSPRAAHALRLSSKIGKVASKIGSAGEKAAPTPATPAQTPAPEQLNPALTTETRTLPGQVGPERIFGPRPTPAQPIPARQGLALPPGPEEAPVAPPSESAPPSKTAFRRQVGAAVDEAVGNKPVELKPNVPLKEQPRVGVEEKTPLPEGFTRAKSSGNTSAALRGYKYNPQAQELETISNNGQHYVHGDVSPDQFQKFEEAPSKGKAWKEIQNSNPRVATVINGNRVPYRPPTALREMVTDPETGEPELKSVVAEKQKTAGVAKPSATAFRARSIGEKGIPYNPKTHAQATMSPAEAESYKTGREDLTGEPQEVVGVDLAKSPAFSVKPGPRGVDWVRFHGEVPESAIARPNAQAAPPLPEGEDLTDLLTESVRRARAARNLPEKP